MSRRPARRTATVVAVVLASLVASVLVPASLFLLMVSAMSEHIVPLRIEATVRDRDTGQPVPRCLLSFVGRMGTTPVYDEHRSATLTDAAGHDTYSSYYRHDGIVLLPFGKRHPTMRLYVGAAPRYGTRDEVETWQITLRFREPWRADTEVVPKVEIRRFMSHDEILSPKDGGPWRSSGLDPLATGPGDAKVEARVSVNKDGQRPVYRILLDVYLNRAQIAACQR